VAAGNDLLRFIPPFGGKSAGLYPLTIFQVPSA
jgi:hypothetical protein